MNCFLGSLKTKHKDTWFYWMNEKMVAKSMQFLFFLVGDWMCGSVMDLNRKVNETKNWGLKKKMRKKFGVLIKCSIFASSKTERVVLLKVWTMV